MHKISITLHKKEILLSQESKEKINEMLNLQPNFQQQAQKQRNLIAISKDIEKENRLAKILELYSKGLTQAEIAQEMRINQSTVSRDLEFIHKHARRTVEKYLNEEILFEYLRYVTGTNEIAKELWNMVKGGPITNKDKISTYSLLFEIYNKRLDALISGPSAYNTIKKNLHEIQYPSSDGKDNSNDFLNQMISELNNNAKYLQKRIKKY